jgi:drug/metabolite transporter (DMT)-like permease
MLDRATRTAWQGPAFVLAFTALSASKGVYLGSLLQGHDPALLLASTFTGVALFWTLAAWRRGSIDRRRVARAFGPILKLNVSTALAWAAYVYALKILEPAVAGALSAALGPAVTLLVVRPKTRAWRLPLTVAGVLLGMGALVATTLFGRSALTGGHDLTLGLAAAGVSGLAMVGNTLFSKEVGREGFDAADILALRFWILLGIAYLAVPKDAWGELDTAYFARVLVIAGAGFLLPLYLLQLGIQKTDPVTVALLLAMMPIFALVVQLADARLVPSLWSLLAVVLTAGSCMYGTLVTRRET